MNNMQTLKSPDRFNAPQAGLNALIHLLTAVYPDTEIWDIQSCIAMVYNCLQK